MRWFAAGWIVLGMLTAGWAGEARRLTDEDYARHVAALRKTAPAGFSIVVEKPFIVIGDEPAAAVQRHAQRTVKWSVELLRKEYFEKDPDEILTIWLFKNADSYNRYTREIFHDTPTTPFGYYSHADRALIMNIATGGGTLVHEIVHPFVRANFPACPAWFNEGLGSLYEACYERDGRIAGMTNWRLPGLQAAIRNGKVPTFEKLTSLGDRAFYEEDRGTNYAQARYLCYYLQERGLLRQYYRDFVANAKEDPTGYKTLLRTLNRKPEEMAGFQKEWEAFVLKLEAR